MPPGAMNEFGGKAAHGATSSESMQRLIAKQAARSLDRRRRRGIQGYSLARRQSEDSQSDPGTATVYSADLLALIRRLRCVDLGSDQK